MLHEFLSFNHHELIRRCRAKATERYKPSEIPAALDHGVPLFLQQLVETLLVREPTHGQEQRFGAVDRLKR